MCTFIIGPLRFLSGSVRAMPDAASAIVQSPVAADGKLICHRWALYAAGGIWLSVLVIWLLGELDFREESGSRD